MAGRSREAFKQIRFFLYEIKLMNDAGWWCWIRCWFSPDFWTVASYRMNHFFYLLMGKTWCVLRIVFSPFSLLVRPWLGGCEIHYRADIGKGLRVLHPSLGVVISADAIVGDNLCLVGGNCIGERRKLHRGDLVIGNNVSMGVNAVILGPVQVGDNINIGAGAVVINDVKDNSTVVGVPAVSIN